MQMMKINQKDPKINKSFREKSFIESISVCTGIVSQLLQKMERQLPPDTQRVLTYSRLMMNKATQKMIDMNLLESEYFNNFTFNESQSQPSSQIQQVYFNNQNSNEDGLSNFFYSPKKLTLNYEGKVSSPKLVEDEQIVLKKQGIKFIKKQELKSLIKHKSSNAFSSLHSSFNPTYQRINTKYSLYQINHQKQQNCQNESVNQRFEERNMKSSNLTVPNFQQFESSDNFLKTQQINKDLNQLQNQKSEQKNDINRERNQKAINLGRFVDLDQYYQQKNKQQKSNSNKTLFKGNSLQLERNKDKQNQCLQRKNKKNNNCYHPTWPYRKSQSKDQDDIVINKLRDRKLKFYKAQNNFNADLIANNTATKIIKESQKGSHKQKYGAMMAFDYNGSAMPTVKYGSLKIPSHYQDMQVQVANHDESLLKRKRQRKGYILGGGINLKLVDHQKFLPHPNYNNDPLVQKHEILMKQNIGYLLKKGVSLRPRQENSINTSSISGLNDHQQSREKINKSNFEFLNNQQIEPKNVKFQQFLKYKQLPLPSNKSISSKKRIAEQAFMWEQSLLSKKSISIKGQKSKTLLQDSTNKVHKSTNSKAFQMLINANHNQMNSNPINKVHFQKNQIFTLPVSPSGVLKKSPLNSINKIISQDAECKLPKKKVRIA